MKVKRLGLFLEKKNITFGKYEVVVFNQTTVFPNVLTGEGNTNSLTVKKGESCKLFFNDNNEVTAIRPYKGGTHTPIDIKENNNIILNNLWEANFMLDTPFKINTSNPPFVLQNYI